MKSRVILIIFLFCNPVIGQLKIDAKKMRMQLEGTPESKLKIDSSYDNYYRQESADTMWFQENSSVIRCETTALVSPYYNRCRYWFQGKPAEGKAEIVIGNDRKNCRIYSGTFKDGFYDTGKFEIIEDGCAICTGNFTGNAKTGLWITRSGTGNIIGISEYDSRLEFAVRNWEYDEDGRLLSFTDESMLLNQIDQ